MDFSKIKKISFILLMLFILLFPFWCISGFCSETETVQGEQIIGITVNENSNYFIENSNSSIVAFPIEKGYRYNIINNSTTNRGIVFSSERPAVNVLYDFIKTLAPSESYSFIVNNDTYFYISGAVANYTMTREKVSSMQGSVEDLVNNVGFNQLWDTFSSSIPMISVCAIFVFGFVIVTFLYLKLSKGKAGF